MRFAMAAVLVTVMAGTAFGQSKWIGGYGNVPVYATGNLPPCNSEWVNHFVFDSTAVRLKRCNGSSWEIGIPASGVGSCSAGQYVNALNTDAAPTCGTPTGGAALPSGAIILILSGTCPSGFTEETALSGKFVLGTVAANSDVGTTGGSDNITPAGTNSGGAVNAHSGTAVADHASHTHTYTDVIAHTHTLPVGATDDTAAPFDRADAGTNASGANATTASGSTGVATGTTAGPSATLTHGVTQPSNHTFTQPTFTGTQFDNRPAFAKVIFCRAN